MRPPDVEQLLRIDRVIGSRRLQHAAPVLGVDICLRAREKPGAHQDTRRAERQGRGQPPTVDDAAGRDHRHLGHGLHGRGDQGEQRRRPADVSSCLHSLGDDRIGARGGRGDRLRH
jgi:hypothetical protein